MTDDPAATSWTRGQTAAFDVPRGPLESEPDAESSALDRGEPSLERRRSVLLGALAFVAALAAIVVQVVAITVASSGDYLLGSTLAVVAIALSGVAVLIGVVALIVRRGRILGIIGAVLGILTNPLVLVALFRFFA